MKLPFLLLPALTAAMQPLEAQVLPPPAAQETTGRDTLFQWNAPTVRHKHPWQAAAKVAGINIGVWAFDRYAMNEDFARISAHSVWKNLTNGFVWDNDQFSTNLFAHPYHGSLYYNAARNSGLNIWESAPYALAGSLMWEIAAEVEPPAINDLLATTIGGIALGEMTHRMSGLVLDDSKRGFPRFLRELGGTLLSPVRGLHRLVSGQMWKVQPRHCLYHDYEKIPVSFSLSAGMRYLADNYHFFKGDCAPYLELETRYGDPFDNDNDQPYDYFTLNATFGLSANQPLIAQVNLLGKLWSRAWEKEHGMEVMFGLYQHFNYFDSEEVIEGTGSIPYKISEAASIGPGIMYRFPQLNSLLRVEQSAFVSAILLGGSLTDYYNVIDRNYNMGSGYSIKSRTALDFGKYGEYELNLHLYQIFTWKGYERKDLETVNPLYLNAQGDKGNVILGILNPRIRLQLYKNLKAQFETAYYWRHTHYSHHPDIDHKTFETRLGLSYRF